MANTPEGEKPASKRGRKPAGQSVRKVPRKKSVRAKGQKTPLELSDETRKQLKKLGVRLQEASDRGAHLAKEMAVKMRHFASEATELTKLKIEIYKLRSQREKIFSNMGEKLVDLYKAHNLQDVQSVFADDFKMLENVEATIADREKAITKITL